LGVDKRLFSLPGIGAEIVEGNARITRMDRKPTSQERDHLYYARTGFRDNTTSRDWKDAERSVHPAGPAANKTPRGEERLRDKQHRDTRRLDVP